MSTKNEKSRMDLQGVTVEIGARLKEERKRLGLKATDFESYGGWPASTIYGWESGKASPKSEFLSLAESSGLDVTYIVTGRRTSERLSGAVPAPSESADAVAVPLLSATASMGPGSEAVDDVILGAVPVSRRWLALHIPRSRPESLRMVHAHGDSMFGTLDSGDLAIVDIDHTTADVDGVYVLQANGNLFIKRVTRRMDGRVEITSDNPSVRTVDVLDGSHQVQICGRVVYGWNGRRF